MVEGVRLELSDLKFPKMGLMHLELPDLELGQMGLGEMVVGEMSLCGMALGEMVVLYLDLFQMIFQCKTFFCGQAYDKSHIFSLIQFGLTESCSSLHPMNPTFSSFLVFQTSSLWEVAQHLTFQFFPILVHHSVDK